MLQGRQHEVTIEIAAKVKPGRDPVMLADFRYQRIQRGNRPAGTEATRRRAGLETLLGHVHRRFAQRQVEAKTAARPGLQLQREHLGKVRRRARSNLLLHRIQSMVRGHSEHHRFKELLLHRALLAWINLDWRGGDFLVLGKKIVPPDLAPYADIDRTVAQQRPFHLHGQRAQRARDDRGQLLFDRGGSACIRPELLDAPAVGIAQQLPEFGRRRPQLVFLKLLQPLRRLVYIAQFAGMIGCRLVKHVDDFVATLEPQPFGAVDRVEPGRDIAQRLD